MQSLINDIQENNWVISKKRVRGNHNYFLVIENRWFPSMTWIVLFCWLRSTLTLITIQFRINTQIHVRFVFCLLDILCYIYTLNIFIYTTNNLFIIFMYYIYYYIYTLMFIYFHMYICIYIFGKEYIKSNSNSISISNLVTYSFTNVHSEYLRM